ncbi:unnamed protein product [Adineta steineri]|uniref:V-SNARE coiled-coil homology domain-containing protein n=1 Tax=Adineta steineri TaxID=433720 RepID=A0A819D9J8_9BILA|nr:unnamed protein product [Adineta steineri]CAF1097961.1 unnamed protein product [Adineta steineri]CAF3834553.1 unnamed protein product [Adineta steineri]CAF3858271.1 unnamed protein product [Adineta steineri]
MTETSIVNQSYQPNNGVYYTPPGQFQYLQGEVDAVTEIMRNNIRLGLERGTNLDDLEMRADDLHVNSNQMAYHSHQVRQKFWWQNVKMWIIIAIIVIIVIALIVVLSVLAAKNKI